MWKKIIVIAYNCQIYSCIIEEKIYFRLKIFGLQRNSRFVFSGIWASKKVVDLITY